MPASINNKNTPKTIKTMKNKTTTKKGTALGTSMAALAILGTLCLSCSAKNQPEDNTNGTTTVSNGDMTITTTDDWTATKTTTKTLDLPTFHAVCNNTSVDITYTQGSKQKVVAEIPDAILDKVSITVKDGMLTLNTKKRFNINNSGIKLHITAPAISSLYNNGSMTFRTTAWSGTPVSISNNGAFTLHGNISNKKEVKFENNGSFTYKDGTLECGSLYISNNGASTVNIPITASGDVKLDNNGSSKITSSIRAKNYSERCNGASKAELDIKAETLKLDIDGAGKGTVHFVGKEATIHGDGSSKLDLDVDCSKLYVISGGMAKITVKGTADETKFQNDGITKVDASGLNNL